MIARPRIDVVIVAGYLGSGKSTLLNNLLAAADGARIGVVVNDFGAVNIDALLVTGTSGAGPVQSVALSNGCICCSTDEDDVERVLDTLAAQKVDVIVIEASGVAEPAAMVRRVVLAENERLRYGGLVYLVDAAEFDGTVARHPSLVHHLALAEMIVLNKIDLVGGPDAGSVATLIERVRAHAPTAPILPTTGARIPSEVFLDRQVLAERAADRLAGPEQLTLDALLRADECHDPHHAHEHTHEHLHDQYQAVDVAVGALDARRCADLLRTPAPGVFRVKGLVTVADGSLFEVHTVGRQVSTRLIRGRRPALATETALVFLGIDLDRADIASRVDACLVQPDAPADPDALLSLLRFSIASQSDSMIADG